MDSLEEAAEISSIQEGTDVLFLNDVPMELRYQFAESIYNGMAHNVFLFNNRDKNLIADVIPKLTPLRVKKGEYVYKKGQHAHKVYILFKGRVHFMSGSNCIFRQFIEGSYFGEIEIFKNIPRQFAVKAAEECELMELSRDNFALILKDFPELEIDILRIALERDIRFKKARRKIRKFDELQSYKQFWQVSEEDKKKPFLEEFKKEIMEIYEANRKNKGGDKKGS
jgi:signal-transduction protein with cAMP-binding, CBS, and nucleotidyltransferase domain